MKRKRNRKNIVMGLIAVGGSLLLTAALLEAGLRIWDSFNAPARRARSGGSSVHKWIAPAEEIGFRLHPDWEHFSAQGSQTEVAYRPAEEFRVLILGDSVAFGGFEESIPGHMERTLRAAPGVVPTQTLNSSVPGYTNYQELVWLKEYGLQFEPELVGIIFVLNDLHRLLHFVDLRPGQPFGAANLPFTKGAAHPPSSLLYRGLQQSYLLRSVRQRFSILSAGIAYALEGGYTFEYRGDFNPAWKDEFWPPIEAQLREFAELGRERGFRVFLVAVPFGDQYREDYLVLDADYVMMPQRRLSEICGNLDIAYFDLYDHLDSASLKEDRVHLTPEARETAGEEIARFLLEKKLIPLTPSPSR